MRRRRRTAPSPRRPTACRRQAPRTHCGSRSRRMICATVLRQRAPRPRLCRPPRRRRQHRRRLRRRQPRRAASDRHREHRGQLPQGHRRGRQYRRRPAHAAADAPSRRAGRHQPHARHRRRRRRDRGRHPRQRRARPEHARAHRLAAGLRGLRPRLRRHRQGARHLDPGSDRPAASSSRWPASTVPTWNRGRGLRPPALGDRRAAEPNVPVRLSSYSAAPSPSAPT